MPNTTGKNRAVLFLTSGLGDNLLSLPLAIELEKRYYLTVVITPKNQSGIISAAIPSAKTITFNKISLTDILKILLNGFKADLWIYPIGACSRLIRLLNLLSFAKRKIGFTSLASEKTWQAEIGLDICLTPDLAKTAWQNNLRLAKLIDKNFDEREVEWENYSSLVIKQLFGDKKRGNSKNLLIFPGCNKYPGNLEKYKRWPLVRFIETAERVIRNSLFETADIFLGPAEMEMEEEAQKIISEKNLSGKIRIYNHSNFNSDLFTIAHFIYEHKYLLSNDSGLAHLASLLEVPSTIIMSGIDEPSYIKQNGKYTDIIWHPTECRGCTVGISVDIAKSFQCIYDAECISGITVDEVEKSITENLNKIKKQTNISL